MWPMRFAKWSRRSIPSSKRTTLAPSWKSHATVAWLAMLSGGSDEVAAQKIAEMLEEIRRDDEAMHRVLN